MVLLRERFQELSLELQSYVQQQVELLQIIRANGSQIVQQMSSCACQANLDDRSDKMQKVCIANVRDEIAVIPGD